MSAALLWRDWTPLADQWLARWFGVEGSKGRLNAGLN
jgi:hypothetical protein